jgi:hypothetical protein
MSDAVTADQPKLARADESMFATQSSERRRLECTPQETNPLGPNFDREMSAQKRPFPISKLTFSLANATKQHIASVHASDQRTSEFGSSHGNEIPH